MLLGSSAGGGLLFVEPPAAVGLNNELAAARGESYGAEEDVLHDLTGSLMAVLPEVSAAYEVRHCLSIGTCEYCNVTCRFGAGMSGACAVAHGQLPRAGCMECNTAQRHLC